MVRVEVLIDTLVHDNEQIARGAELELEPAQAQQLLDVGAVRELDKKQGAKPGTQKPAAPKATPPKAAKK